MSRHDPVLDFLAEKQREREALSSVPSSVADSGISGSKALASYQDIHSIPNRSTIKKTFLFNWRNSPENFNQLASSNPAYFTKHAQNSSDASRPGAKLILIGSKVVQWHNDSKDFVQVQIHGQPNDHEVLVAGHSKENADGVNHSFIIPLTGPSSQPASHVLFRAKEKIELERPTQWIGFSFDQLDTEEIVEVNEEKRLALIRQRADGKPSIYLETLAILAKEGQHTPKTIRAITYPPSPSAPLANGHLVALDDLEVARKHIKKSHDDSALSNPGDLSASISPLSGSWTSEASSYPFLVGNNVDFISQGLTSPEKQISFLIENEYLVLNMNEAVH